jgi:hypothetical protein
LWYGLKCILWYLTPCGVGGRILVEICYKPSADSGRIQTLEDSKSVDLIISWEAMFAFPFCLVAMEYRHLFVSYCSIGKGWFVAQDSARKRFRVSSVT